MTEQAKPAMSAGCIVIAMVIAGFVVSAVGLFAVIYYRADVLRAKQGVPTSNNTPLGGAPPVTNDPAEKPTATPAQQRALEGGSEVAWNRYGLRWSVPAGWTRESEDEGTLAVKSAGGADAAWLTVTVSSLPATFPYETSLNAMHQQAVVARDRGEYSEVRWIELDGVRGVEFVESPPPKAGEIRRIQWQAYRVTNGQVQLLNVMVHSSAEGFDEHEDELLAVLYSTKVARP